jgi:hypothetical protein
MHFTWDVAAGLPLLLADGTASYVYGPGGQILEQIAGSTPTYYHSDQLGSVRALTDQSRTFVGAYAYDAYGQLAGSRLPPPPRRQAEAGCAMLGARRDPASRAARRGHSSA